MQHRGSLDGTYAVSIASSAQWMLCPVAHVRVRCGSDRSMCSVQRTISRQPRRLRSFVETGYVNGHAWHARKEVRARQSGPTRASGHRAGLADDQSLACGGRQARGCLPVEWGTQAMLAAAALEGRAATGPVSLTIRPSSSVSIRSAISRIRWSWVTMTVVVPRSLPSSLSISTTV